MPRAATKQRIPSLRRQRHKHRPDRAYVVLNTRRRYLGRWEVSPRKTRSCLFGKDLRVGSFWEKTAILRA
jgi:hypothetical protein